MAEWQTRRIQKRASSDSGVHGDEIPRGSDARKDAEERGGPPTDAEVGQKDQSAAEGVTLPVTVGQPGTDVVEAALAEALRGATAAGRWEVVAQLARELEARREARAGVVKLDSERRRRERGGS